MIFGRCTMIAGTQLEPVLGFQHAFHRRRRVQQARYRRTIHCICVLCVYIYITADGRELSWQLPVKRALDEFTLPTVTDVIVVIVGGR